MAGWRSRGHMLRHAPTCFSRPPLPPLSAGVGDRARGPHRRAHLPRRQPLVLLRVGPQCAGRLGRPLHQQVSASRLAARACAACPSPARHAHCLPLSRAARGSPPPPRRPLPCRAAAPSARTPCPTRCARCGSRLAAALPVPASALQLQLLYVHATHLLAPGLQGLGFDRAWGEAAGGEPPRIVDAAREEAVRSLTGEYCLRAGVYASAVPENLTALPGEPCRKLDGITCIRRGARRAALMRAALCQQHRLLPLLASQHFPRCSAVSQDSCHHHHGPGRRQPGRLQARPARRRARRAPGRVRLRAALAAPACLLPCLASVLVPDVSGALLPPSPRLPAEPKVPVEAQEAVAEEEAARNATDGGGARRKLLRQDAMPRRR